MYIVPVVAADVGLLIIGVVVIGVDWLGAGEVGADGVVWGLVPPERF